MGAQQHRDRPEADGGSNAGRELFGRETPPATLGPAMLQPAPPEGHRQESHRGETGRAFDCQRRGSRRPDEPREPEENGRRAGHEAEGQRRPDDEQGKRTRAMTPLHERAGQEQGGADKRQSGQRQRAPPEHQPCGAEGIERNLRVHARPARRQHAESIGTDSGLAAVRERQRHRSELRVEAVRAGRLAEPGGRRDYRLGGGRGNPAAVQHDRLHADETQAERAGHDEQGGVALKTLDRHVLGRPVTPGENPVLPLGLPDVDRDRRGRGVAAGFWRQGVQPVEQPRQVVGLAGGRFDRGRGVMRDAASERLDIPAALSDPVPDVPLQARRGGGGRGAEAPDLGANPDAREQHRSHDRADDQPGGGGHH